MIKKKINNLLNSNTFIDIDDFGVFLENPKLTKRYSIMKECEPALINDNIYQIDFCFFFYSEGWLKQTFYCSIQGFGHLLENEKLTMHEYLCSDTNRVDWEWVDVN